MNHQLDNIFSRRVAKILPSEQGLRDLLASKKVRVYQGFDPTAPRLHLGHAIGMKKLMDFAHNGHEVIFLFGTGTVLAGDPSLRSEARQHITPGQVDENIKNWKAQASLVVDFDKVHIKKNGDWLNKMTLPDVIGLASHISSVQLFKRESFTRRIAAGSTVWFSETMYPLLQGYDSVVMDVDLEIGGTDQEFNMLMGRELQAKINKREKFVLETPMILGTDGQQMSKSSDNCVWLDDSPEEKFGKLMSLGDSLIIDYLTHLSDMPLSEVGEYAKRLTTGTNPKDIKLVMAEQIVKDLHGGPAATSAKEAWQNQFEQRQLPAQINEFRYREGQIDVAELLVATRLAASNSEARRLLDQGGVRHNGEQVGQAQIHLKNGDIIQVGKRHFVKITS